MIPEPWRPPEYEQAYLKAIKPKVTWNKDTIDIFWAGWDAAIEAWCKQGEGER